MVTFSKIIFGMTISLTSAAYAQATDSSSFNMADLIRQKVGFAAEVPASICQQSFPFNKVIRRSLASSLSFNLFAFTAKQFDSKKPSILFIHGGPGALWGPKEATESANQFPDSNVIFFHYRGGGCSSFPNAASELDRLITSNATIDDMEAIRTAYEVTTWKAVVGFSYGTDVGRRYAHRFPNKMKNLVLEGLNSSTELPNDQSIARILKTISERYKASTNLQALATADNFKTFLMTLKSYFSQVSPQQNFGLAALWWNYQKTYEDYYKNAGAPFPKYLNRDTFLSVTLLVYNGENSSSDYAIWMLLNNFGFISPSAEQIASVSSILKIIDKMMFPFLYPDYLSALTDSQLLSWRVQLAMPKNDKSLPADSVCSGVDTLVLSGTQDLATPVENVQTFLSNKKCATGSNVSLLVQGGGHSSLASMKCLSQYVGHYLNKEETSGDLSSCELPVTVQRN
jgi:pimeloyl-ACP methyl ester carboxylesterase